MPVLVKGELQFTFAPQTEKLSWSKMNALLRDHPHMLINLVKHLAQAPKSGTHINYKT